MRKLLIHAVAILWALVALKTLPAPRLIETYLTEEITDISVISTLVALDTATPDDTVIIHINSPGGSVDAGNRVVEAMKHSKAKNIIAKVHWFAASMAAEIANEAPVLEVQPDSVVLIHTVSMGPFKILPYGISTAMLAMFGPEQADLTRQFAYDEFIMTTHNSWGLWGTESFNRVATGYDVIDTAMGAGRQSIEDRASLKLGKFTTFSDLVLEAQCWSPSDQSYLGMMTGFYYRKMLTFTFHPMLIDLSGGEQHV